MKREDQIKTIIKDIFGIKKNKLEVKRFPAKNTAFSPTRRDKIAVYGEYNCKFIVIFTSKKTGDDDYLILLKDFNPFGLMEKLKVKCDWDSILKILKVFMSSTRDEGWW